MTMRTKIAVLLTVVLGGVTVTQAEEVKIDKDMLAGKRFRFSWSSASGSAVNGTATLEAGGRIEGIGRAQREFLVDRRSQPTAVQARRRPGFDAVR